VESVVTFATQRFLFVLAIQPPCNQWQILGCNRPEIVALHASFLLRDIRNFASTLQSLPDARDRIARSMFKKARKKKLVQREVVSRASKKLINQEMQRE
jgi:hypothetical protein